MLLAVLIGFTRLYVGVHYPTDVLLGAVLGVIFGVLGAIIIIRTTESLHYARLKRADFEVFKHGDILDFADTDNSRTHRGGLRGHLRNCVSQII